MRLYLKILLILLSPKIFAVDYTAALLKNIKISRYGDAAANYISVNNSTIKAEVKGKVLNIKKDVGSKAQTTDVLVELECSDYLVAKEMAQAEVKQASAQLKLIDWQISQSKKLLKENNISIQHYKKLSVERDKSLAAHQKANANYKLAVKNAQRCKIVSPFECLVTERFISKGDFLLPNTPVLKIIDTSNTEVAAYVHYSDSHSIINSNKIWFETESSKIPLQIKATTNFIDSNKKTQLFKFTPQNGHNLIIGSVGRLKWEFPEKVLPAKFIQRYNNNLGVFIISADNKVVFHKISDAIFGQPAATNLSDNTKILVGGRVSVAENQVIKDLKLL